MADGRQTSLGRGEADAAREAAVTTEAERAAADAGGPRDFYAKRRSLINTFLSILIGLLIWQVASARTTDLVMVGLDEIWQAFVEGVADGTVWIDFWATTRAFLAAFALASVAGVLIGLIMATSDIADELLDPWVSAFYATPLIAVAPLFIVIFGLGLSAKIAVAFILAVLPVIINTSAGIRTVDRNFIEAAHSFGANRLQIFRRILIPGAMPFILTGLRLAVGRALIGVVVAEFFGSLYGLGHRVFTSAQIFDTANVFVGMFILMGMGVLLFKFMHWLERKIAPWREFKVP